jgi:hypothetical protein
MRRLALVLVAVTLASVAPTAAALDLDLNLSAGLDFSGTFDVGAVSEDAQTGYSLGLELMFDVPFVEVGIGAEYGFDRSSRIDNVDVSYTFVYAVGRINFIGPAYAVARYGYSDLSAKLADASLDGGASWSAGLGLKFFGKLRTEVLLNQFSGDVSGVDVDYDTWSLRVLYTF